MITGCCFCERVSYEIDGALRNARACHCSRCRKTFSGASSAYAEVDDAATFRWLSGGDTVTKYQPMPGWIVVFCSTCGTTLCGIHEGVVHGVTLGSVNGDPGVEIEMHLFVGSKAPWDHIGGTAPQYEERPPNQPRREADRRFMATCGSVGPTRS